MDLSPNKQIKNGKPLLLTTRDLDSIPKSSNHNSTDKNSSSKNDKFDSSWITDMKRQLKSNKSLT